MAGKRQILSLTPKHAVAMVTDFQRKISKLQCSGEHRQCVQYIRLHVTIVQYNAKTLESHLKIFILEVTIARKFLPHSQIRKAACAIQFAE
jgi:hypothetical protein